MDDTERIKELGGATKLAELLGFEKAGGVQRVHNWLSRGIPAHVKVKWPDLFLVPIAQAKKAAKKAAKV